MTDWCAWPAEAMKSEDRHSEHLVEMLLSVYLEALVYQQCVDEILVVIVVVGFIGLIIHPPLERRETGSRQCLPGLSPQIIQCVPPER